MLAVLTAVACVATGLVLTGSPAQTATTPPGTLVFIKNHDIWMARGDGSGQVRITKDGTATEPYASPTMSDNGTIAAVRWPRIVRLDRTGKVLNRITTPRLPTSTGGQTNGTPHNAAISPDGATIVFSDVQTSPLRTGVGYVNATTGAQVGLTTYWDHPSWVTNSRTLHNGGYGSHVQIHELSGASHHWFDDGDVYGDEYSEDLSDTEISRDGKWLIAIRSYGSNKHVIWYRVNGTVQSGTALAVPTPACMTGTDAQFADPTLAPDGSAAAWTEGDGIWIKDDLADCDAPQPRLAIPGASEASWSKAAYAVPVPRRS
jgi:hypothetical protein